MTVNVSSSRLDRLAREHAAAVRRAWIVLEATLTGLAFLTVGLLVEPAAVGRDAWSLAEALSGAGLAAALWGLLMYGWGLYQSQRFATIGGAVARLAVVHAAGATVLGVATLLTGASARVLWCVPVSFVLLALERSSVLSVVWQIRRRGGQSRRALLVAEPDRAPAIIRAIRERPHLALQLTASVTPAELASGNGLLRRTRPDEILVCAPGVSVDQLADGIVEARLRGITVRLMSAGRPRGFLRAGVEKLDGWHIVTLFNPRGRPGEVVTKRLLDVVGALAALVLTAPVMGLAALAVALEGGMPIYRQTRVGRDGRAFTMYKLRTMVRDADAKFGDVAALNEMTPPVFKAANDPRVTHVGRFLRRWSIDELPQLFNVLSGDMSLVGPRPARPHEVARYETWQKRRLCVRPGITGPWQVSGRSDVDFAEWMLLDVKYLDHWTLWRDVDILARTLPAIVSGRGAR